MATRRRTTAGFQTESETSEEVQAVETPNEAVWIEVLEVEKDIDTLEEFLNPPFVEQVIVPTEDIHRFVSEEIVEPKKVSVIPAVLKAPPKRHPRNTPKFSSHK